MGAPLWRAAFAYAAAVNAASAGLVVGDKRAAVASAARVPEATLVAVAAAGGWPAGILAMRAVRHKTRKRSFQRRYAGGVAANVGGGALLAAALLRRGGWVGGGVAALLRAVTGVGRRR